MRQHLMTPVQEATKTWHWNCTSARSHRALLTGSFCRAESPLCSAYAERQLSSCKRLAGAHRLILKGERCSHQNLKTPFSVPLLMVSASKPWTLEVRAAGRALSVFASSISH